MSSPKPRKYVLSLCYTCQKCLHCEKDSISQRCKCKKGNKTPEVKKGQQRKHYSRVFQPNNSDKKPYNSWQLKELKHNNEYFGYKIDFSEEFSFSLCPKCHGKFNRLGRKKEAKIQEEPFKTTDTVLKTPTVDDALLETSNVVSTSSLKTLDVGITSSKTPDVGTTSLKTSIVIVDTPNMDSTSSLEMPNADTSSLNTPIIDVDTPSILQDEESDADSLISELKFKLILKFSDGKCYPAKWEYIVADNFHKFKDDLEILVQSQFEDQIIFQDDYIVSYKHEKENGLGTQITNVRDWMEFLKEYDHMVSSKKTLLIIITMKKKSNKRTQSK
jgi:hypothetical protein